MNKRAKKIVAQNLKSFIERQAPNACPSAKQEALCRLCARSKVHKYPDGCCEFNNGRSRVCVEGSHFTPKYHGLELQLKKVDAVNEVAREYA